MPPAAPPDPPDSRPTSASPGVHFLQGMLMGGADVIPGVSGGTVALIVGIYERLVDSIRNVVVALVALLKGDRAEARRVWRLVEWGLVGPLAAGIVIAVLVGFRVIPPLRERYPSQMYGLFFGLIAGSLVVPWRRLRNRDATRLAVALAAGIAAALLVGLPPREVMDPALPLVFGAAAVAICAMILPGVSGAFLLLVLGVYDATAHAVTRERDVVYVAVFLLGAAAGLGTFSRLLSWLLHHRHDTTMAVLVGLMAGSLRALWPWQTDTRGLLAPPADVGAVLIVVGLAAFGFVAVSSLIRFGGDAGDTDHKGRLAGRRGS